MESMTTNQNTYSADYANVHTEDYNALLESLRTTPSFEALSDEGGLMIVHWAGVGLIRAKSSGNVTIRGNYTSFSACKDFTEDNIPNFEGHIDDGFPVISISPVLPKGIGGGAALTSPNVRDLHELIRADSKMIFFSC